MTHQFYGQFEEAYIDTKKINQLKGPYIKTLDIKTDYQRIENAAN